MKIVILNSCDEPIYEQIKTQILNAVLTAELLPGELLPSLRTLAKELKVGVLTVNRAYTELESEGYVENVQGKGCFVAEKCLELVKRRLMEAAADKMKLAIRDARKAGASDEEIAALFHQCLRRLP